MRWRETAGPGTGRRWALTGVVLLHALFAMVTWKEMQLRSGASFERPVPAVRDNALQVRLIAAAPRPMEAAPVTVPAAPVPVLAPRPAPAREKPSRQALKVLMPSPKPKPQVQAEPSTAPATAASIPAHPRLKLFDKTGQPVLAPAAASTAPAPDYVQRKPEGDSSVMEHRNALKQPPTSLDKYFPPPGENIVQSGARKLVQKISKPHNVRLPGGIHLKCTLLGGCQDPPPPPSAKDGDMRLSMAPAQPLADIPDAPKPPDVNECIAIYRAGKALPQGCPVDTPARAVDAQMRQWQQKKEPHDAGQP